MSETPDGFSCDVTVGNSIKKPHVEFYIAAGFNMGLRLRNEGRWRAALNAAGSAELEFRDGRRAVMRLGSETTRRRQR